jgi:YHS domain-containing protein
MDNAQQDPVCNMEIDEQSAAGRSQYEGQTYYFCTESCKDEFDRNPQQYVNQGAQRAGQSA